MEGHVYIGCDIEDGDLVEAESNWSADDAGEGFISVRSSGNSTVYVTGDYSIHVGEIIDLVDAADESVIRTYTADEDVISTVNTVFGWMSHNEGTITVGDVVVTPAECCFLYKNADVDFTMDRTTAQPDSGIILQMMDNDANGFAAYQTEDTGVKTETASLNVSCEFTSDVTVERLITSV